MARSRRAPSPATDPLIACTDVDYRGDEAVAACVTIARWEDDVPSSEDVVRIAKVADYEPGSFYLRELPCVLAVLRSARDVDAIDTVVVDGYVWLAKSRPGLGARLFEALAGKVPVIGVAKTAFKDNDAAVEVLRGTSTRPLHVTAEGIPLARAAACVAAMHGAHRLPSILKRVDRLARDG